ncbi:MAG TPA: universal stress protein [Pyrinomonadaceae bacterium]|jgi:nucleotide-binding universal stress UspA family protein
MKILVAYDGSESADAALEDLKKAGLPAVADVLVMSLADVFLPPADGQADAEFPLYASPEVQRALKAAQHRVEEAETWAKRASERLKATFPLWQVGFKALADSPAWALIREADEWKPDLIVMGSRGHSVFGGRLILGSVSQRVLYEAGCCVRIARAYRKSAGVPTRILVGVDHSSDSYAAVEAVRNREWPEGTEVRLVAVVDTVMAVPAHPGKPSLKWIEVGDENGRDEVRKIFEPYAQRLRHVGLDAAVMIRRGNPADEIIDEAETWEADSVFVGAKGTRGIDRLLLGSVSSAVAARAHCSVEVVRRRK